MKKISTEMLEGNKSQILYELALHCNRSSSGEEADFFPETHSFTFCQHDAMFVTINCSFK